MILNIALFSKLKQNTKLLSQSETNNMSDPKYQKVNGIRYPTDEFGQLDEIRILQSEPILAEHVINWEGVPEYTLVPSNCGEVSIFTLKEN